MAWGRRLQSIAALALTLALGWRGVVALTESPGEDLRHPAIRETAWLAVAAWAVGWPRAWRGRGAGIWAWGALASAFHVAVAMHVAHGWSHAAAVRHTEAVSGVGAGVWVNYAFVAVWLADAAWLTAARDGYRRRPRWVAWAIHGFLAFVVVNAAVVFVGDWRVGLFWAVVIANSFRGMTNDPPMTKEDRQCLPSSLVGHSSFVIFKRSARRGPAPGRRASARSAGPSARPP